MNKILLLSISVMLGPLLVHALNCHVCKKYLPGRGCLRGKSYCDAPPGKQCKIVFVTNGNGKEFERRGCSKGPHECNRTVFTLGTTVSTTCCEDQDLCNDY